MHIGVFDSGLGGLFTLRVLRRQLPAYDYVYVGDTKRVPYGNRSQQAVYEFTRQAVEYLLGVLQFQDVKLAIPGFTSYILAALVFGVVNFIIHLFIKNNDQS